MEFSTFSHGRYRKILLTMQPVINPVRSRWGDTAVEASGTSDGTVGEASAIFFISLIVVGKDYRLVMQDALCHTRLALNTKMKTLLSPNNIFGI